MSDHKVTLAPNFWQTLIETNRALPPLTRTPTHPPDLLTPVTAAAYLGLAEQTLAQWRTQKKGPAYVKVGSRVRYRLEDLREWTASRRVEGGAS